MKIIILLCLIGLMISCGTQPNPLHEKVIVLDAGHGGTADIDEYRMGPAGEREEWVNLRVAEELEKLLSDEGATVIMTRTEDVQVELADRAQLATDNNADLFLSIHHNATADSTVNFPITYYHGNASENLAGVKLATIINRQIRADLFGEETPYVTVSDHTIFPQAGTGVLRNSYGIPGVITELSFFTHPEEEQRLMERDYNREQAKSLLNALKTYFSEDEIPIHDVYSTIEIPPFSVFQEEQRMSPEAKQWLDYYENAKSIFESDNEKDFDRAYELATQSIKFFPDSYVAGDAHLLRAKILEALGESDKAQKTRDHVREFYPE